MATIRPGFSRVKRVYFRLLAVLSYVFRWCYMTLISPYILVCSCMIRKWKRATCEPPRGRGFGKGTRVCVMSTRRERQIAFYAEPELKKALKQRARSEESTVQALVET